MNRQWIAPVKEDSATGIIEARLWAVIGQFRDHSSLTRRETSAPLPRRRQFSERVHTNIQPLQTLVFQVQILRRKGDLLLRRMLPGQIELKEN